MRSWAHALVSCMFNSSGNGRYSLLSERGLLLHEDGKLTCARLF